MLFVPPLNPTHVSPWPEDPIPVLMNIVKVIGVLQMGSIEQVARLRYTRLNYLQTMTLSVGG